jgi:hypothetical protein
MYTVTLGSVKDCGKGVALALFLSACGEDGSKTMAGPIDSGQGASLTGDARAPGNRQDGGPTSTPGGGMSSGDASPGGPQGGTPGGTGAADGGSRSDGGVASDAGSRTADSSTLPGDAAVETPICDPLPAASSFKSNNVGGGGTVASESDHFRVFGGGNAEQGVKLLEATHQCFVEDWCWRSPGLSITNSSGTYNKFNLYTLASLGNAAGVQQYDATEGLAYLQVVTGSVGDPRVVVHEFGHALTLSASANGGWVNQTRTGAWWEAVANFVADTFLTSTYCEAARSKHGIAAGNTIIDVNKVVGNSNMMILSDQNYYEAWPFFTYLTNNPDGFSGLGRMVLPNLIKSHKRNNETPLHVLERLAAPVAVQRILGRYWARMAYVDIGHPKAQAAFMSRKASLNQANLDAAGSGTWKVKAARQPQYGGASIIPLKGTGQATIQIMNLGNGRSESDFTATLAIRTTSGGAVRYVDLPDGMGQATIVSGEEASLVVVNTPKMLYQYDAFNAGAPETTGLNYQVQITGGVTP